MNGKKLILLLLCFLFLVLPGCNMTLINDTQLLQITSIYNSLQSKPEVKIMLTDSDALYWTPIISDYYGYDEYWMAWSRDKQNWSSLYYTGIPANDNFSYDIALENAVFSFSRFEKPWANPKSYYRAIYSPEDTEFYISKSDLFHDVDADGLTDLSEYVLKTDPLNNDSDHDGKADGYDNNPLAGEIDPIFLTNKVILHRHIIEKELYNYNSSQLVIVEQFNKRVMEYKRSEGIVLSLPPDSCDAFINEFGYGVPILTATVRDTLGKYKVNFQFFVDPEQAWGYDAIYNLDRKNRRWLREETLFQWQSTPE